MKGSLKKVIKDFDKAFKKFVEASKGYDRVRDRDVTDPVLIEALKKCFEAYKEMTQAHSEVKHLERVLRTG